jgi:hypothetical protein
MLTPPTPSTDTTEKSTTSSYSQRPNSRHPNTEYIHKTDIFVSDFRVHGTS